jgi:hypothetical protein
LADEKEFGEVGIIRVSFQIRFGFNVGRPPAWNGTEPKANGTSKSLWQPIGKCANREFTVNEEGYYPVNGS